ncbi:MAG: ATP-binding protein [candidate division Zixibacteria bacterium]|nr:ATP-binding protein [candidate division Zixibacteria bacterium]
MSKTYRLTLLSFSFLTLMVVGYSLTGSLNFVMSDFWFTSGLLLLILLSLIDQPHFSKDSNVFINSVMAGVSLLLVKDINRDFIFWVFFTVTLYLLLVSYILLWVRQKQLAEETKSIKFFSRLNREIGKPDVLFSAFFIWGAFKQFGVGSTEFNALFIYWVVFKIFNIPSLSRIIGDLFVSKKEDGVQNALGQIFGVQSKNTFLVKLFDFSSRTAKARIFDFVEFQYSTDKKVRKGLLLDTYLLNQVQWIKVLSNSQIENIFSNKVILKDHSLDVVYKLNEIPQNDFLKRFVGIVTDNSRINNIRFIYNSQIEVSEGQLLEVSVNGKNILYQIVEGITKIETLEQKNQTGLIIGEALQLGNWNQTKFQFEQFGWVPGINSPVFLASKISEPKIEKDEFVIGKIPNTNYPVTLNKTTAMSHHLAVIGVTGTGKSIFSRNLIREFIKDKDTKVICIDFTGEYIGKFTDLNPKHTIPIETSTQLFKDIDNIEKEIASNFNKDNDKSRKKKKEISLKMNEELKKFLEADDQLSIFELPHVENTSGVLTYTKTFFRILFHIAKTKNNFGKRVCLVLEEAHTIVPEWSFSGVSDKISQPLLNSIAQIALQGRKYNVGLLVIAQRTANVSKTILTQCNTIISFQEFDKTSSDFLANYFGQNIVGSLPKLKFRQAIAAGKAFRSSVPMIFEVPEIKEE